MIIALSLGYLLHLPLKKLRKRLYPTLWLREHLLYVIYSNHLYTTYKDDGYEKVARSAILQYEIDSPKGHIIVKVMITGDEFSKKVQLLDDVLAGVLELELDEKIICPSFVEYHFYYKKPDRLVFQSCDQKQERES